MEEEGQDKRSDGSCNKCPFPGRTFKRSWWGCWWCCCRDGIVAGEGAANKFQCRTLSLPSHNSRTSRTTTDGRDIVLHRHAAPPVCHSFVGRPPTKTNYVEKLITCGHRITEHGTHSFGLCFLSSGSGGGGGREEEEKVENTPPSHNTQWASPQRNVLLPGRY